MMEKIMGKINDTSNLGHSTLEDHGKLADSESGAVTGGMLSLLSSWLPHGAANTVSHCPIEHAWWRQ
jgi:hypothetical protein